MAAIALVLAVAQGFGPLAASHTLPLALTSRSAPRTPRLLNVAHPPGKYGKLQQLKLKMQTVHAKQYHDMFNIASISGLFALTAGALSLTRALNLPLAICICVYIAVDTVWLALRPDIFDSPRQIWLHHILAMTVAVHAATWAPHTRFTSWMGVVELSTLLLVVKRYAPARCVKALDVAFKITWVASRVVWFPILAVYLTLQRDFPSVTRRVFCSGCCIGLAALQWFWTVRRPDQKRAAPGAAPTAEDTAPLPPVPEAASQALQ